MAVRNVSFAKDKSGTVVIQFDPTKEFGPSASGKTVIVAATGGNVERPGHENTMVSLNVYRYPSRATK